MGKKYQPKSQTHQKFRRAALNADISTELADIFAGHTNQARQASGQLATLGEKIKDKIAGRWNISISDVRVKSTRSMQKVEHPEDLKDTIALRIFVTHPSQVEESRKYLINPDEAEEGSIKKFLKNVQFKDFSYTEHVDRIARPTGFGYNGSLKFCGKLDIGGGRKVPFEIQVMHEAMFEIDKESHLLYEQVRPYIDKAEKAHSWADEEERISLHADTCIVPAQTILKRAKKQHRPLTFEEQDEVSRLTFARKGAPLTSHDWEKVKAARYANIALYDAQAWKHDLMGLRDPNHVPDFSLQNARSATTLEFERDASYLLYKQAQTIKERATNLGRPLSDFERNETAVIIEAVALLSKNDSQKIYNLYLQESPDLPVKPGKKATTSNDQKTHYPIYPLDGQQPN